MQMQMVSRNITDETEVKVLLKVGDDVKEFSAPIILVAFDAQNVQVICARASLFDMVQAIKSLCRTAHCAAVHPPERMFLFGSVIGVLEELARRG